MTVTNRLPDHGNEPTSARRAPTPGGGQVYEVARFRVHDTVREEDVVVASERLHEDFLSKYDGVVYRELMSTANGVWFDTVHWESTADFSKAAADVFTDPDAAGLMELIDMSTLTWFHAQRTHHWSRAGVPTASGANDLHLFRLVEPGAELEGRVAVSLEEFETRAAEAQPRIAAIEGFVDRELHRTADNWLVDLVHWTDAPAAARARRVIATAITEGEPWAMDLATSMDPKSHQSYALIQRRTWGAQYSAPETQ